MTKNDEITLGKVRITLYVTLISLCIVTAALFGCEKEKTSEVKWSGHCEIIDKLHTAKHIEVSYENRVKLLGLTADKISQNQLEVSYYWQLMDKLGPFKQVFVHFIDPSNKKILFQDDHLFCQNQLLEGIKGKLIKETHMINIPESLIGEKVSIMVGLYAPELRSGPRLKIQSAAGVPIIGNAAMFEKVSL